jgi:hypothetical protein
MDPTDEIKFDVSGVVFTLSRDALTRFSRSSLAKMAETYWEGEPVVVQQCPKMFAVIANYINSIMYQTGEPFDLSDFSNEGLQRLGREICSYDLHDMARRVSNEIQRRRRHGHDDDEEEGGMDKRDSEDYHKLRGDAVKPGIGDRIKGKMNSGSSMNRSGRIQSVNMRRMIYTSKQSWEDDFEGDYQDVVCTGEVRWDDNGTVDDVLICATKGGHQTAYFQYDTGYSECADYMM